MPSMIQQGNTGAIVSQWQAFLNSQGANLSTAGSFGPVTEGETRAFQQAHGLMSDGIVGPVTWNKARQIAGYVYTNGTQFELNGQPFRFVGVNLRGLIHYGDPSFQRTQASVASDRQNQLNQARAIGAKVVRVTIAGRNLSPSQVGDRLQTALDEANPPGQSPLYFLVTFADVYFNDTFLTVQGDDQFYNGTLTDGFYQQNFNVNYLPFVEYIVTRFRDDRRIFAWELGNEFKTDPATFINFADAVSNCIFERDAFHLVTTGIINCGNLGFDYNNMPARNLYTLPNVDFGTAHYYQSFDDGQCFAGQDPNAPGWALAELNRVAPEITLATGASKPVIIEEYGCCAGNRAQETANAMTQRFGEGARGFLQWGFMAPGGTNDTGDGDHTWGMDEALHGDYAPMAAVYQQQAVAL